MSTFKCKMCGGTLEIEPNETIATCEYCGTQQTLPKLDDERRANLYDRANHFRRNNEFDKAMGIYEKILNEDNTDAEAYWSLVLCRYGIEYVEDPASHKRVPTVNRAQFTSIYDDDNYKSALQYADSLQRSIYEAEAATINEIQKGILEISSKEEPFDVFICYKESDANGRRTPDSVLATELYHELTNEGFKVFFSRITLEDKLGTAYEPYIFAALNSAKVMVVLGTKPEYFNAVWVKNEWSRYLALIKAGQKKILIPAYKDMDPYDLPEEFSHLQAQDMTKLGFMQDLIRGIDKLLGKTESFADKKHQTVIQQVVSGGTNVDALLKRGYDSLEDSAFEDAKTFFNDALNSDAQSADAYLGLFMAEIHAKDQSVAQSKYVADNYTENRYWKRAKKYAFGTVADMLNNWDALRDARLQREADDARKAKNEKAKETKEAQERIKKLQEQLYAGNSEMTAEEQAERERLNMEATSAAEIAQSAENVLAESLVQEVASLEEAIASKKTYLSGLGFFKGKEKRELQTQIDAMEGTLAEKKKNVSAKQSEVSKLKKKAVDTAIKADEYTSKLRSLKEKAIYEQIFQIVWLNLSVDRVTFGHYEQCEGIEPIVWRVLERTDKGILLISQYAIDWKEYHWSYPKWNEKIKWETCDLRKWLNQEFLKTAFNEAEQSLIVSTRFPADNKPPFNAPPENATTDKIFLLSISDVKKYFVSEEDRIATSTTFAKKKRACKCDIDPCYWWLRSRGHNYNFGIDPTYVDESGTIRDVMPWDNDDKKKGIRPALWIHLNDQYGVFDSRDER